MRENTVTADVTIIGGGLAGVCAAIAAARLGQTVTLINNRPVLGGNSSSEVRVWVCGATGHGTHRYAREGGIMGELFVENQYRNPEGNPYYWDLVVLDTVRAEPNITLFLNTDVREVEASGPAESRKIHSVTGWTMGSELLTRYESSVFLDCTGDGLVGFLAGAEFRIGREAQSEFGESWAPEVADDITLGSTLLFYTKDAGEKIEFIPPSFAKDISTTSIPERRIIRSGDNGCAYWWIEWGGELDTVHENERIRDELWSVIYGIWDYIKNSGKFDADTMTLEWVGALPGKREYRRFVGDYILNQNDVLAQVPFDDRIAFGGWSIDLHPPAGVYAAEAGSKHLFSDGNYHIPYRSLYSVNVDNLLFAGRNISASHVAFGSTRVMATCATLGEAAGTAGALCVQHGVTPRQLGIEDLQQTLLRQDGSVIGLTNSDERDLARSATVAASSSLSTIAVNITEAVHQLDVDAGFIYPVESDVDGLWLALDAAEDTELTVGLYDTGKPENYVPANVLSEVTVPISAGAGQWVEIPVSATISVPQNMFVAVGANDKIALRTSETSVSGLLSFVRKPASMENDRPQPVREWRELADRRRFGVRVNGSTTVYSPDKVIDGYVRPFGGPHLWVSEPELSTAEQWVELSWADQVEFSELRLTFNDDVNEDLINLHHHRTPYRVTPHMVRDYRIETWDGGEWKTVDRVEANRKRLRVHQFESPVTTIKVRVVVELTYGSESAELFSVRVY